MMGLLSACTALSVRHTINQSSPQTLLAYVRRRPDDPSTGVLQATWLPSGRPAAMPRSSSYRPSSTPTGLRVSPDSRCVAWIALDGDDRFLWIYDVRSGNLKQAALLIDRVDRLEWLDTKNLLLVQAGSIFTISRRADGWSVARDWPNGSKTRARELQLSGLEARLMRRKPGMGHRPICVSPSGRTLAVVDSVSGGTLEQPNPKVRTGYVRRTLVGYDARTLKRTILGPTWEQFQFDPPDYTFAGFAGGEFVVVRNSSQGGDAQILLYARGKNSRLSLPGLRGDAWSIGGTPWLEALRDLRTPNTGETLG